jgi:hypothetical protein
MNTLTNTRTWLGTGAMEGAESSFFLAVAYALWFGCSESIITLSWVLSRPAIAPTPKSRLPVGTAFGLTVALIASVAFITLRGYGLDLYVLLVGIPSLVYIGASLWLSQKISITVAHTSIQKPLAPRSRVPAFFKS